MRLFRTLMLYAPLVAVAHAKSKDNEPHDLTAGCPGYKAVNVRENEFGLRADLLLDGPACHTYGSDMDRLVLEVAHETNDRLHVKIYDHLSRVYQVPESVFPRPGGQTKSKDSNIKFNYQIAPFSFSVTRPSTGDLLFDTSAKPLIFQSQYVRLRTRLAMNPYLYGLGEHADSFRLPIKGYVRTLWNRDGQGIREGRNLYGSHPFYMQHLNNMTHGVFLLNSNGMDVHINNHQGIKQYLEYNLVGGVLDFWFLAGPSPTDVARQYSEVVGRPAMPPYWALGAHQSRHGYRDVQALAQSVTQYERAGIPLEAIWTDVDYMNRQRSFSLDPVNYPLDKMQPFINHLHSRNQRYVATLNPAVAFHSYAPFHHGVTDEVFFRRQNGSLWLGVSWPGATVFPDWFSHNIQRYYNKMFKHFFANGTGLDVDGISADMNEPALLKCKWPCDNPFRKPFSRPKSARKPPKKGLEGWPCEIQRAGHCKHADGTLLAKQPFPVRRKPVKREEGQEEAEQPYNEEEEDDDDGDKEAQEEEDHHHHHQRRNAPHVHPTVNKYDKFDKSGQELLPWRGLRDRSLLFPEYTIRNRESREPHILPPSSKAQDLSTRTLDTDLYHQNGLAMYDTHNLYGNMMVSVVHSSMLNNRPGERPFILSRSTFPGGGTKAGHWLGDNRSTWQSYLQSVRSLLSFTALYQYSLVGADVCGFAGEMAIALCARWTALGAFYPFYRNHNAKGMVSQEPHVEGTMKMSAQTHLRIRYRLLDYLYTAMWRASVDGTPVASPLWFQHAPDETLLNHETSFYFGPSMLVAPLPGTTNYNMDAYVPDDRFYTWHQHKPIDGGGRVHRFSGEYYAWMPILIRGASIIPTRESWALTTPALRKYGFELLVALDKHGRSARGQLYLDDGISINTTDRHSIIDLVFHMENTTLSTSGIFNSPVKDQISKITILGAGCTSKMVNHLSRQKHVCVDSQKMSKTLFVTMPLDKPRSVTLPPHELKCFGDDESTNRPSPVPSI